MVHVHMGVSEKLDGITGKKKIDHQRTGLYAGVILAWHSHETSAERRRCSALPPPSTGVCIIIVTSSPVHF